MRHAPIPHRRKVLLLGLGAVALVLLGAGAGAALLLSGAYSTAATKQHFAITYRVLETGLRYSLESNAEEIEVPDLSRVAKIEVGHACYRRYCVQCHGAPGVARDPIGRGQLPSPSRLEQSAREWPPSHLFYVTQKGVRMTGMPAWEYRISQEGLWSTVAFLKRMPFMTQAEYAAMGARSDDIACPAPSGGHPYSVERARTMFQQYSCHNCHRIDGVVGPETYIGPALHEWPARAYIAGVVPNTRANLARWIADPQVFSPTTLMPDMDVVDEHAQHMARYLFEQQ